MRYILIVYALLILNGVHAVNNKPLKVLFIGNSLTYYNDMPQTFRLICEASDKQVKIKQITFPGVSLYEHLFKIITSVKNLSSSRFPKDSSELPEAVKALTQEKWDVIVLQDRSCKEKGFELAMAKIKEYTASYHPRFLMYQEYSTILWSKSHRDSAMSVSIKDCNTAAAILKAEIIPIGECYNHTLDQFPEIELFPDNIHPSPEGSFLIANLIYQIIYHEKVKHDYTADLGSTIAEKLFRVVRLFVS